MYLNYLNVLLLGTFKLFSRFINLYFMVLGCTFFNFLSLKMVCLVVLKNYTFSFFLHCK